MVLEPVKEAIIRRMREHGEPYAVARKIILEERREGGHGRDLLEPGSPPRQPGEPRASTVAWQNRQHRR